MFLARYARGLERTERTRTAAFLVLLAVYAIFSGCTVTLIGDYDDVLDKAITDVQQTADAYFSKLIANPNSPYDQTFHDGMRARLIVLQSRAATLPKYAIISEQIANLKTQFDNFQQLDKTSGRPIGTGVVNSAESSVDTSVESILKLEIALKRTGKPPA
jgi:hypothetical protein